MRWYMNTKIQDNQQSVLTSAVPWGPVLMKWREDDSTWGEKEDSSDPPTTKHIYIYGLTSNGDSLQKPIQALLLVLGEARLAVRRHVHARRAVHQIGHEEGRRLTHIPEPPTPSRTGEPTL